MQCSARAIPLDAFPSIDASRALQNGRSGPACRDFRLRYGVFGLSEFRRGFAGVKPVLAADVFPPRLHIVVHPSDAGDARISAYEIDVMAAAFLRADVLMIGELQVRGVDCGGIDVPVAFDFGELPCAGVHQTRSGGGVFDRLVSDCGIHIR